MKNKIAKLLVISLLLNLFPALSAFAASSIYISEIETGEFQSYSIYTEHFQIEFNYIVYIQPDSNGNGVPDTVDDVAEYAEKSWDREITSLGFDSPIRDDAYIPYIPIILDDQYEYLYEDTTGVTSVLSDLTPYIAVDPWLSESVMKATVSHEFMHAIQFGYDPYFLESYQDLNFAEASAVWAEDYVYPSVNDYLYYLDDFFDYPDYSIFAGVIPSGTLFEYSLMIWPKFLTEYYDDDEIMVTIWEDFFDLDYDDKRSALTVYTAVNNFIESQGDDLSEVYREFAIWNLAHDQTYNDGTLYPDVYLMREWDSSTEVSSKMPLPDMRPALYGTNYIEFETSSSEDDFKLSITKGEDVDMGVTFVPMDASGEYDLDAVDKNTVYAGDTYGEFIFEGASDYDYIYVLVSPIDTEASVAMSFDVGYSYYYSGEFGDFNADAEVVSSDATVGGDSESQKEGDDVGDTVAIDYTNDELTLEVLYYDEDGITVGWDRLTILDISYYVVYMGEESEVYDVADLIAYPYITTYAASDLASDSIYYFVVEAYDEDGVLLETSDEIAGYTEAFSFGDVLSTDDAYEAIMGLYDLGVIQGYDDGNFYPDQVVNRAELLKILIEGQGITPDEDEYQGCFDDVGDEWFAKYVCYAKEQGWVVGYGDGNFYPAQAVNKVEALKMLLLAYGYDIADEDVTGGMPYTDTWPTAWYAPYVKTAFDLGILTEAEGSAFESSSGRDRAEICDELWELLSVLDLR